MKTLVGTSRLIRFVLRRERLRLSIWLAVLIALPVGTAAAFIDLYPAAAERERLAGTVASNPAMIAFLGPINGSSIGALTTWRIGTLAALLAGLMVVLAVIRHTREEEETGRRELLGATVVGRHAPLVAAMLVSGSAGLFLGLLVTVGLVGQGLPVGGALAYGVGLFGVSVAMTAVAGLIAQLTEGATSARGISIALLGVAFLLRMLGDSGESRGIGWLSWTSPIGWFGRLRPFAGERWSVVALWVGLAMLAAAAAFAVSARRDVGAGAFPTRFGRPVAAPNLSGPLGLAWRLHRSSLLGWSVGLGMAGVVFGSVANSLTEILGDNPQLAAIYERLGSESGITDVYFSFGTGIMAMVASAFAIRTALRLRVEEESLRAEPILATATPRLSWAGSHLVFAVLGPAAMLAMGGAAAGAIYGAVIDDGQQVWRVIGTALNQLPAVWVILGLAVALFGVAPRLVAVSWGLLVVSLLVGQLGEILQFPQWVLDVSPFTHIPSLLTADGSVVPLYVLTVIAVALFAIGLRGFRHRDVGT
ncbi:MAG: ABC transporter permease [Acidimicrobiia bacterium]